MSWLVLRSVARARPRLGGRALSGARRALATTSDDRFAGVLSRARAPGKQKLDAALAVPGESPARPFGLDGAEAQIHELQTQVRELLASGECNKALEMAGVCKDMVLGLFGETHPVYASALNNIGMIHKTLGNFDEAIEAYSQAVRVYREVLGDKHVNTLVAMENHAHAYKSMADMGKGMERHMMLEKAKSLFEEVLETKMEALGEENVQTGMTMQSLGGVLRPLKEGERATKLIREGKDIVCKFLPNDHPAVATVLNNFAVDCKVRGELEGVEALYKRALEIRKAHFGQEHEQTLAVMHNLAELYHAQDREEQANALRNEILDIIGVERE